MSREASFEVGRDPDLDEVGLGRMDEVDDAFGHLEGYPDGRDLDRLG